MTNGYFENKVAVITGGSRNIGRAVAAALVERGCRVVIGDVLDTEGQKTIQDLNSMTGKENAVYLHTDVTKYADLIALFELGQEQFGGVDFAFLNAGISVPNDIMLDDLDDEKDERLMKINTMGIIKGSKVAVRYISKRGGGAIVNTASTLGLDCTNYSSIYNASKHAVVGWSKSYTQLPNAANIRMNALCPHGTNTELLWKDFNEYHQGFHKTSGLMVDINTIVKAVLLLLEDEQYNGIALKALPGDAIEVEESPKVFQKIILASQEVKPEEIASNMVALEERAGSKFKKDLDESVQRYFQKSSI
ncbi:hypothetical protein BDA99DRAFT_603183 [Phascolomyces articulosus]|uniref:NAD(P)-binding protein n=1 Tax=Phascolomyces articulosus TaxID=60185 RepID=A0AAD5K4U8_9FUNG|nr:hypothetical protein BDA99DRAFT_603183 [Phascolomyces articulosus]